MPDISTIKSRVPTRLFYLYNRYMWLLSLAVHLVGIVGYNLLLRRALTGDTDKWLLATILQTGICIPAVLLAFVFPFKLQFSNIFDIALLIATVVLTIFFHACNVKALQYLEASVYSVVFNTRFITVSFLGAVLLSEPLTLLQIFGGLLIFCSVFIVRQDEKFSVTANGLYYGLATAVLIGFLNVTEKMLNQSVGFLEYFVPVSIICTVIMWAVVIFRRTKVSLSFLVKPATFSMMGFRAMSAFGFSFALVHGPVALSNYISSLSVVLTVVLGVVFLNERDKLKSKIAATIVAIVGLTLILIKGF